MVPRKLVLIEDDALLAPIVGDQQIEIAVAVGVKARYAAFPCPEPRWMGRSSNLL